MNNNKAKIQSISLVKKRVKEIYLKLDEFRVQKKSIFLTSSFQTQSLVLLKIISDHYNSIPIYFLNTGYHFPETIQYKQQLTSLLNLNVIDLYSDIPLSYQLNANGRLLYTSDTDSCCELNKILPLQKILYKYDVWVTGIRKDQTEIRKTADMIENLGSGKIKYNPLLDWTSKYISRFIDYNSLPKHPLDPDGLISVGCQPCTRLVTRQSRDQNRWFGQTKSECGLHLNFEEEG